jgi:hypothetical protein
MFQVIIMFFVAKDILFVDILRHSLEAGRGLCLIMARVSQSRPDSGLGFQVEALESFEGVPSSFGSGADRDRGGYGGQDSLS